MDRSIEATADAPVDDVADLDGTDVPADTAADAALGRSPRPALTVVPDVRTQARLRRLRRRRRRRIATVVGVVLPWSWFVVRELAGLLEAAAVAMPLWIPAVVAALVLLSALVQRRGPLYVALSVAVLGVVGVLLPWRPLSGGGPIADDAALRVMAANVAHNGGVELLAAIREGDADVVVVSEVEPDADAGLTLVYPYAAYSDDALEPWAPGGIPVEERANQSGVAVYSRYPLQVLPDLTGLPQGLPGVRVQVAAPGGAVLLYGLHLTKATPTSAYPSVSYATQRTVAEAVRDAVDAEQLPVIVAGDLNLVDRQETFRDFADGLRDAMRAGAWAGPTSAKASPAWRALLARIDHVLVTPSLCAESPEQFALPTSDHHGLAVTVGPCATD